jgi:hypothetical protein
MNSHTTGGRMAKAKEAKVVTIYAVESGWRDDAPKVVALDAVEKPKSWEPLPGQRAKVASYLPARLLKEEPGRRKWFTDREEAVRLYVERMAYANEGARARAEKSARDYIEAIEFATREGVYVEGHSTPDVPDPKMRKPGFSALSDAAREVGSLAESLGPDVERIDARLGILAASVAQTAAEIDRILDAREGKA